MSKLAVILKDMYAEAKIKTTSRRTLGRGLKIELNLIEQQVIVTLQRDHNFPSVQEWDTIMKYFPYDTPRIMPEPRQQGSRYLLTGKVPAQRVIQLKFG